MTLRLHYGIAVAVFYTVFASATVGFVAFAMTQEVQLVRRDYYEQSLQHDRHALARANGTALADRLVIANDTPGGVEVRWPAEMAPQIRGTATLYRPSDARADRSLPIVPAADGHFTIPTRGLASGLWRLQLQWRVGEIPYYAERVILLP